MESLQQEPLNERETHELRTVESTQRGQGEMNPSIVKINRIINYAFVLIESTIFLRVLLKLLSGNPGNGFVGFIFSLTDPFVYPFLSAFNWQIATSGTGIIELGSILAIGFYVLISYAIVKLVWILSSRS